MPLPVEATHLGQKSQFPQKYSPELLVGVPRSQNRSRYGIDVPLPFVGVDVWHAYEIGFLTDSGLPVVGVLKMTVPVDSPSLPESKSVKLYLNSFNMERLGKTRDGAIGRFVNICQKDLSACVGGTVTCRFYDAPTMGESDFGQYALLEDAVNSEECAFEHHLETPALLQDGPGGTMTVGTHLLRSNCKITGQPDWGTLFLQMEGIALPTRLSLLQYLVSFRAEHHFHEEVCEMVYKRLVDRFSPQKLVVTCLYTRRGGIDICPTRAMANTQLPRHLTNPDRWSYRTFRQ